MNNKNAESRSNSKGITIWLTGLSGSGKSTIARATSERLLKNNITTQVLDGDILRTGINKDLGFSAQDRSENIRRVSEISKLFNNAGIVVISALISPYNKDRISAAKIIGDNVFSEVYVNAPIDCCIKRDPKGLYKKAINGEIPNFTGISDVYEPPLSADLTLNTDKESIEESVDILSGFIMSKIELL